jgi:ABC-type multidrug transport system ATPase subunit/pSer/pThr/pTyr-binding forkhead associated (FHA) protein
MNGLGGQLEIQGPGFRETRLALTSKTVSLGRTTENLVTLPDPSVSRRHAHIFLLGGQPRIMDLGSMNGTVVNGVRLAAHQPFLLRVGDQINIGPFRLTYAAPAVGAAEAVPGVPPLAGMVAPPDPTLSGEARATGPSPGAASATSATAPVVAYPPPPVIPTGGTEGHTLIGPTQVPPRLTVWYPDGGARDFYLISDLVSIGRAPENTIQVEDPKLAPRQAEIRRTTAGFELIDLGTGAGVYRHGQRIERTAMADGDTFRVGERTQLAFRGSSGAGPVAPEAPSRAIDLGGRATLTFGRAARNDLVLDHPLVSRFHARLEREGDRLVLVDLGSTNGTYVDGETIARRPLAEADHFQIGPFDFLIKEGRVERTAGEGNIRVDAIGLTKRVGRGLTILSDISLSIKPREFVAVVGASGSGKTTLLDALSGFRPATEGKVLYNGNNLHRAFNAYRTSIGYVPQDDIIHRDLTVYRALKYSAMLRFPKDAAPAEREQRIEEVLADLGLSERRNTPINLLSGGQRKRVSIGVELLTRPSLFFLDEPTSGLDAATETRMMRLLRELADQGRTLILITHATQNILLCDKVAFLSGGGHLAFFGTPREALDFFQVQEQVDIYERLDREQRPAQYAEQYRRSPYHDLHLGPTSAAAAEDEPAEERRPPPPARGAISRARQFAILTRRYLDILLANRRALAILLLQAPIIALLIGVVFPRSVFNERPLLIPAERVAEAGLRPDPLNPLKNCGLSAAKLAELPPDLRDPDLQQPCGDVRRGMVMLFVIALVSIWFGTSNAAKEIVKELPIYRRERMVSLKILPYLGSKLTVLFGVALVQTLILLAIVMALVQVPFYGVGMLLGLFGLTYATAVTATLLGLLVSAVVGTIDEAGNVVPILLIPQILFAGAMLSLSEMGTAGRYIAQVVISKWGFEALGAIVQLPRIIRAQGGPMLNLLEEEKWKTTFDLSVWADLGILALFGLVFLVGAYAALKRKDSL